jgi:glyoxylase-like metal-dependent hydrolase (beta-lactamase superfamily II)
MDIGYNAVQWSHGPKWVLHERPTEKWFGFDAIAIDPTLKPRILLVPLPGHTRGHCGVAVETEKGWMLQCGDAASPYHKEGDPHQLDASLHRLRILPDRFAKGVAGPHVPRLRQLLRDHGDEVEMISAHDMYSFHKYSEAGQT